MRAPLPFAVCLLAVAAGCASSPPVDYYTLETTTPPRQTAGTRLVAIGPFALPEYLDRPQLVTRARGGRLRIDELVRWGEPLDDAFRRIVALEAGARAGSATVIQFPARRIRGGGLQVTGQVTRFDAGIDDVARLDVQWAIRDTGGDVIGGPYASNLVVPIEADYPAGTVAALAEATRRFGAEVGDALARVLAAGETAAASIPAAGGR